MKATFYLLSALLCLNTFIAFAQNPAIPKDSIYYHGAEKFEILIQVNDYHHLTQDDLLINMLDEFKSKIGEIQQSLPDTPYSIEYTHQEKIEIRETGILKSFRFAENKGWSNDFKHQANLNDPIRNYHVTIGYNEIDDLIATDFPNLVADIIAQLPIKDRYLRYLEYGPTNGENKATLIQNRPSGYLDMLSLMAGVGGNVYRNRFITDITGEIGLQLNHKGILRNQFYVSNNLMFTYDAENIAIINNFTSIGYRRNLTNKKDESNWLGIELSTLTKRSGDLFHPNTMRLGMNWQAGINITVSPQLYFNGFFQQVSPGLRIGIGL